MSYFMGGYVNYLPREAYFKTTDIKKRDMIMNKLNTNGLIGETVKLTDPNTNQITYHTVLSYELLSNYTKKKHYSHIGNFYYSKYKYRLLITEGDNHKSILLKISDYSQYPLHEFFIYGCVRDYDSNSNDEMRHMIEINTFIDYHLLFGIKRINRVCKK